MFQMVHENFKDRMLGTNYILSLSPYEAWISVSPSFMGFKDFIYSFGSRAGMTQQKQIQKSAVRPAIFSWFRVSVSLSRNISASVDGTLLSILYDRVFISVRKKSVCPSHSSIDNVKIFENSLGKCRHY